MTIIGLSGTNGSGKDTVGAILAEKHGFLFVSVTELLRDEVKRRGQPVDREHLRALSAEWRREFGLGVLVDRAVELYKQQGDAYQGLVMASLRNPAEADRVHQLGGDMWWIDADPRIRYDRVQRGAAERGRAGEDIKTFEQFQAEGEAEMYGNGDPAALNMSAVRDLCDVKLLNESSDLSLLDAEVTKLLK